VAAPLVAAALVLLGLGVTASPLFSVRTVAVTGNARLSVARVIHEARLDRPSNVYWFHTGAAQRLLEEDPWIASATISKELPHKISIHVVERHPASRVQVGSAWLLVATDGTVLDRTGPKSRLPALPATGALTIGRRDVHLGLASQIAGGMSPWLRSKVASVLPQSGGQVVLELARGGRVLFGPPTELAAKERALAGIVRWGAQHHRRFEYVDLRAPLAPAARAVGAG
jgi:cell division protein FtsQ